MTSHVTLADSIQASVGVSRSLAKGGNSLLNPAFPSHAPSEGLGCVRMVLLNAVCIGSEILSAFENIYVILTLRYLGVPLPLIGINSLVSGCFSIVLVPLLGYWTDRGPAPKLRKLSTLVMGACAYILGLAVVATSTLVKMGTYDTPCNATDPALPGGNLTTGPPPSFTGEPCVDTGDSDGLPLTGLLGMLGFGLLDVGFDLSMSLTRAFILGVVPPFQHTSVLVAATSLSALGGMMYSTLGLFDLTDVLSAYVALDGITATILLLCGIQVLIVLATFGSSIAVGYSLYRSQLNMQPEVQPTDEHPVHSGTLANHVAIATQVSDVPAAGFTLPELRAINEEKVLSIDPADHVSQKPSEAYTLNETLNLVNKDSSALGFDKQGTEQVDSRSNKYSTFSVGVQCSLSMNDAARQELSESRGNKSRIRYQRFGSNNSISSSILTEDHNKDMTSSNAIGSIWSLANSFSISLIHPQNSPLGDFHSRKLSELANQNTRHDNLNPSKLYSRIRSLTSREGKLSPENVSESTTGSFFNKRVVLLALASFCTFGNLIATNFYLPNTLTVEILHGDPTAPPDTPEFEAYQSGLRMASLGYLVYYSTNFVLSVCNKKIMDAIGPSTEFFVVSLAMFIVTAIFMVTQRQEVFLVVMAFLGFHKCMTYTVIFILATKVSTSDVVATGNNQEHLGRIMSVVGAMVPAQYVACGVLIGPLMDALGTAWIASWYTLFVMVGAVIFMGMLCWDMRKR